MCKYRSYPQLFTLATFLGLTRLAAGQSLNFDMNMNSGAGAGVPASSFAAAANQPGYWNSINAIEIPFGVRNLAGQTTNVTLSVSGEGNWAQQNQFGGADFQRLMEDAMRVNPFDGDATLTVHLSGLANGGYVVYTMAQAPDESSYDS